MNVPGIAGLIRRSGKKIAVIADGLGIAGRRRRARRRSIAQKVGMGFAWPQVHSNAKVEFGLRDFVLVDRRESKDEIGIAGSGGAPVGPINPHLVVGIYGIV